MGDRIRLHLLELTAHSAEPGLEDPLCARHIHCLLSSLEQPREISEFYPILPDEGTEASREEMTAQVHTTRGGVELLHQLGHLQGPVSCGYSKRHSGQGVPGQAPDTEAPSNP